MIFLKITSVKDYPSFTHNNISFRYNNNSENEQNNSSIINVLDTQTKQQKNFGSNSSNKSKIPKEKPNHRHNTYGGSYHNNDDRLSASFLSILIIYYIKKCSLNFCCVKENGARDKRYILEENEEK